ncbi:hypothetical protein WA171_004148 [Blastocystis sp. BT1]
MNSKARSTSENAMKKPNKVLLIISLIGFVISVLWVLLSPYISFSKHFNSPSIISIRDKNIVSDIAVTVTDEELKFAKDTQDRFCAVDSDDLDERLRLLSEVFKENGLTFNTHYGDVSLFNHDNVTTIGRFPTLVYGVWHPVVSTGSPTSIILSTEWNLNATANPKSLLDHGDCNYAIPSSLTLLLSTIKSIQTSGRMNHDVVLILYVKKYYETMNHILTKQDINAILPTIQRPLFSIHLDNPETIIPLTETFSGYSLEAAGMNGKNANLDLVAIVLKHLPVLDYQSSNFYYLSFLKSFFKASFSRYRGIQQVFISKYIPAVTLQMHSRPATLQERTYSARVDQLRSLLTSFKSVVESAGSAEKRLAGNAITYIPLFSSNPRFIVRNDILFPVLMLLAAFAALMMSVDLIHTPHRTGLIYCGLVVIVSGSYLALMRCLSPVMAENRLGNGFSLFIVFFLLYSFWAYCRLVFNNALIQMNLTTEWEYKKEVLSMCGMITCLFSYVYIMRNPFIVMIVLTGIYGLLLVLIIGNTQNIRYVLLLIYSALLAIPFILIINDDFVQWMGDLVALMIDDSWLFCYLMIVVVADLAILHYVNGVSFLAEEESQEEVKEKMD